jgi:hypothetical protein
MTRATPGNNVKEFGVQALACDFHFRAFQGNKLKLELQTLFLRSLTCHRATFVNNEIVLSPGFSRLVSVVEASRLKPGLRTIF